MRRGAGLILGVVWALVVLVAVAPGWTMFQAVREYQGPGWALFHPVGWDVVPSRSGGAVAFVAPARPAGGISVRPSLLVSASAVPAGTSEATILQVAAQGTVQALPGSRLLGEETAAAGDGKRVHLRYYSQSAVGGGLPMYLVLGVAVRGQSYVLLGATSSALPDYREQAAVFRTMILSFRGR